MEYKVLEYSQQKAVILGLDINDLLILDCLQDVIKQKALPEKEINGNVYYWLNYNYILDELPILRITKPTLMKKYKKFVKLNILDFLFIEKNGEFTYFRVNETAVKHIKGG